MKKSEMVSFFHMDAIRGKIVRSADGEIELEVVEGAIFEVERPTRGKDLELGAIADKERSSPRRRRRSRLPNKR
jgi:hypothetical protein